MTQDKQQVYLPGDICDILDSQKRSERPLNFSLFLSLFVDPLPVLSCVIFIITSSVLGVLSALRSAGVISHGRIQMN
jgi:hypothetical protein